MKKIMTHRKECGNAQEKLCIEKDIPMFAPPDGNCYRCGGNIYDRMTLEKCAGTPITGCPICGYSFCD